MPERRNETRPDAKDRRTFPRPPLWLTLTLLIVGCVVASAAIVHRRTLDRRFQETLKAHDNSPGAMAQLRSDLAKMDVSEEELKRQLDGRMKYIQSLQSNQFYLAIDTSSRSAELHFGADVVRTMPVQIGESKSFSIEGKNYSFPALKGAFKVVDKVEGMAWRPAPWVYAMNGQSPPADRPTIENGLGRYVIVLPNNYVIHSQPAPESPLHGPKPGSFLISEEDLRAIWPRISKETTVYIF